MKHVHLVARDGRYTNYLYDGELNRIIEVNLEPFDLEGDECIVNPIHTRISISSLQFPGVYNWKDLENKTYEFIESPYEDDDISMPDSSIYLTYFHSPVYVTSMEFGEITGRYIRMSMKCEVDFDNRVHGMQTFELSCLLEFGELSINPDFVNPTTENLEDSKDIVKQYVSLDDYQAPEITRLFLYNKNGQDVFFERISFAPKFD